MRVMRVDGRGWCVEMVIGCGEIGSENVNVWAEGE
jgi:hypothetical protein